MSKIGSVYVPAEGKPDAKVWIIGEAPGQDEVYRGKPFVGKAGEKLDQLLESVGIDRSKCYITNLCHYRPHDNKFKHLENSEQLKSGLLEIVNNLLLYTPRLIILLGSEPLKYIAKKEGISKWRGSIIDLPVNNVIVKLLPTYHPSYILRDPIGHPTAKLDLLKAYSIINGTYKPQERNITVVDKSNLDDVRYKLKKSKKLACDIETTKSGELLCVGFATSPYDAYVVPYSNDINVHELLVEVLSDETIEKIFHNGSFDVTVLGLKGYEVKGYTHDTLIAASILNAELPKDLAYLTSVYTDIPYYKEEGRAQIPSDTKTWGAKRNKQELYIYNGKDCYATFAIHEEQLKDIGEELDYQAQYAYNMEAQLMAIDMSNTSMLIDHERRILLLSAVQQRRVEIQHLTNAIAKNIVNRDVVVNTRSTKAFPKLLYEDMKLPVRKKHDKKKGESRTTTDENALVSLLAFSKKRVEETVKGNANDVWRLKFYFIENCLKLREYDKLISSYLNIKVSEDGRVRCMYRVCGTETGRWACNKFIDGTGVNMQTIPRVKLEV